MARRIVRTFVKVTFLSGILIAFLYFLDSRFRVLPNKVHSGIHYLLPEHHTGSIITDLEYLQCTRLSSCTMDTGEGWSRIGKDVFLGGGWVQHGFINVRRKKQAEFLPTSGEKVVVEIKISRKKPDPSEGAGEKDVEWESRAGGIWIKRQSKMIDSTITAVDILFGPDAVEVREGWQLKEGSLSVGESPRLTVRRGEAIIPKKASVHMDKNHMLKIIQVSDLHLSTGVGECRDAEPPETAKGCEADPRTLNFIRKILDDEKPDMAVLSGDQINGDTAPDIQTALFKFAEPFISRKIPFATILGNHDDEGSMTRKQIMELTASLPYSLSELGPELGPITTDKKGREVHEGGAGNYLVEVKAHNRPEHSAVTLYFLDTHAYSPDKSVIGYDWIKPYQIDWFKNEAVRLKDAHNKYSFIHLNMAFIHIPLPEYRLEGVPMVGEKMEPPTAPVHNSGFKEALVNAGVMAVSAGHDHANDYCLLDQMWMCYAGGSGFGGYGGYKKYNRRVRLFEVNGDAGQIKTWKRVEYSPDGKYGRLDEQVIVRGAKVVSPSSA
ncbi:Metallo-dependent phosphatase [Wilcoxina mikolae CBS 423.85]|nr:Metallo-dependent phosphatase [Wilcoxina mikolae CBS 423.85]